MARDNGGEIVKKYPVNVDREIILLIAGRISNIRRIPRVVGRRKKEGWFPNGEHIHGTEPNGKWRLNYRLRRILRVCTAARGINVAAVVCVYRPKLTRTRQTEGDERRCGQRTKGRKGGGGGWKSEDGRQCWAALKRHNSNSPGSSKINQLGRSVSGY